MLKKAFNLLQGKISFLYLFYTFSFLYRCKIGKVDLQEVEKRQSDIQANMSAVFNFEIIVRKAMKAPLLMNDRFEKLLHRALTWLGLKYNGLPKSVNGYTEWFWFANPILATAFIYYGFKYGLFIESQGLDSYMPWWFAVCAIPIPIDYAILMMLCVVLEICVFLAAFLIVGILYTKLQGVP